MKVSPRLAKKGCFVMAGEHDGNRATKSRVRGAAVWALSQLMARDAFSALAQRAISAEADESVRTEWRLESAAV